MPLRYIDIRLCLGTPYWIWITSYSYIHFHPPLYISALDTGSENMKIGCQISVIHLKGFRKQPNDKLKQEERWGV